MGRGLDHRLRIAPFLCLYLGTVVRASACKHTATGQIHRLIMVPGECIVRKLLVAMLCIWGCALAASAQTYTTTEGFTITQAHPRLWIPAGSPQLTQAETWAANNPQNCAHYGGYLYSQEMACIAFYHVTTGSDCSTAVTWAANVDQSNIVNGWPPASSETVQTVIGSNDIRWSGEYAMLVYDWCHDQWSSTQISGFVSAMNTWLENIELSCWSGVAGSSPFGNPQSCTVNGDADDFYFGYLRNDLDWGIVTYGTDNGTGSGSLAEEFIAAGMNRWNIVKSDYVTSSWIGGTPPDGKGVHRQCNIDR